MSLAKTTLFTAIVNSIVLGYLYLKRKNSINHSEQKTITQNKKHFPLKCLIDGNNIHRQSKENPIAAVIVQPNINVEEIFKMFNGELFVIHDSPDSTSYDIVSQLEYAITHLGINIIFTLVHPNDSSVLQFLNIHDEKFDKKIKYALQNLAQERLHNIIQTINISPNLKCYYAVYDQKSGEVRFFHYYETNQSRENNLKESFVLYDKNSELQIEKSTKNEQSTI